MILFLVIFLTLFWVWARRCGSFSLCCEGTTFIERRTERGLLGCFSSFASSSSGRSEKEHEDVRLQRRIRLEAALSESRRLEAAWTAA